MPISFPPLETINPFLFGREDYDLRVPQTRDTVKDLVLTNTAFFLRSILKFDDFQPCHVQWFDFEEKNAETLLLGPRGSLKCVHPFTLVAHEYGATYAYDLQQGQKVTSVFKDTSSQVNVVGKRDTESAIVLFLDHPYDFWISASPEHKFFCYNMIRDDFEVIPAKLLNSSVHFPLLSKPSIFKPNTSLSTKEIERALNIISDKKVLPRFILEANTESLVSLIAYCDKIVGLDVIKEKRPLAYNSLQVLRFYHGLIKLDDTKLRKSIRGKLLSDTKDLHRDKIAFLVDADTDYMPSPLQVNNDLVAFVKLKDINSISFSTPISFYDCNVTNSHYIANGFVTHNSTVTTVGKVLHSALRDPNRRFGIISSTSKLASGQVKRIKNICQTNQIIRYCFQDIINPKKIQTWSNEALEFARTSIYPEPTIWALGEGTDFTGFHFDEIHFDDLVTVRHRKSATLRRHTWDWFRMTAIPAIEKGGGKAHVKGTRYHWDDMYGKLIEMAEAKRDWLISRTPACDEDLLSRGIYKSFWPSRYPEEDLISIRAKYGEDVFWLQYMCSAGMIISQETSDYLKKIRERLVPVEVIEKCIDVVLGVDLATRGSGEFAESERKASFAVTVIGRHEETEKWIAMETVKIKRPTLNDQREWLQTMQMRYNPLVAAIERNAYQSVFLEYLDEGDVPVPVKPVKSFESKDARFEFVVNMIVSGSLLIVEELCRPLIEEITIYPETTADCIDSLFFALRLGYREPRIRWMDEPDREDVL
jgi:hypothetical protein